MSDDVESFLERSAPKYFAPSEVAETLGITTEHARRRLRKLVNEGKVQYVRRRYGWKAQPQGQISNPSDGRVQSLAAIAGIDPRVIYSWIEERKAKSHEDKAKEILFKLLKDAEGSRRRSPQRTTS